MGLQKTLELPEKIMRYHFKDGRSIIYLKHDPDELQTLVNELKNPSAIVLPAYDYMQHPVSDKNYALLVTLTILVAEMLKIPCPQLELRSNMSVYGNSIY